MRNIIIGFSSHPGIFSTLIKLVSASKVSHTYVRIPVPEYGESMVFQASGLIVNYTNYRVFQERSTTIEEYEIEVPDEVYTLGEMLRVTEAGKPYSMKEIVGLLWILFMRNMGRRVSNPFRDGSSSYVCVELAMRCVGLAVDSENVTQEDFRRWCADNGKLIYRLD